MQQHDELQRIKSNKNNSTKAEVMQRIIEKTEDGSATLFVPELNEHYHSVKGARTESQHIFIDMGVKASATAARISLKSVSAPD